MARQIPNGTGAVYVLIDAETKLLKIGFCRWPSDGTLRQRIEQRAKDYRHEHKVGCYTLVSYVETKYPELVEREVHKRLRPFRMPCRSNRKGRLLELFLITPAIAQRTVEASVRQIAAHAARNWRESIVFGDNFIMSAP